MAIRSGEAVGMTKEEIEQEFINAGWGLEGSFADHLLIGYSGDGISLLAHKEWWGTDDPLFEVLDHEGLVNYWVREAPTPEQAQQLLREHGRRPQEEWA